MKKKGDMSLKISDRLLSDDDKFWSVIKDENKRIHLLSGLYRSRIHSLFLMSISGFLTFALLLMKENATVSLFMFAGTMLLYLDTESKIRTIRLYELLSATNQNS